MDQANNRVLLGSAQLVFLRHNITHSRCSFFKKNLSLLFLLMDIQDPLAIFNHDIHYLSLFYLNYNFINQK